VRGFVGALTRNTRWLSWAGLVFGIQIGMIIWFSDRGRPAMKKPAPAPMLSVTGSGTSELLELRDPTLFALPHYRTFSGDAWLKPPAAPERSFEWAEDPRWLALEVQAIPHLPATKVDSLNAFEVVNAAVPESSSLSLSVPSQFPDKSAVRINGGLSNRKLLASLDLPSWGSTNLLTNTVIRLMVDSEGLPRSQTLLIRSGATEADNYALRMTRNLRFEPITPSQNADASPDSLAWGEVVFAWHGLLPTGGSR
jgi:TonB family protein